MTDQHFAKTYAGNPPANYERFFVPEIGAPLATDLISLAALRPGERVLDVACGTTAEIQKLVSGAGFHDVSVQSDTKPLRLPAPEEFLWQYVHSTPLAGAVAQIDDERRGSLERDVVAKWRDFMEDRALVLHVRIVVAIARK
jgi:hypothetical protein